MKINHVETMKIDKDKKKQQLMQEPNIRPNKKQKLPNSKLGKTKKRHNLNKNLIQLL